MIFNPPVELVEKEMLLPDLCRLKLHAPLIAKRALPGNFVQIKVSDSLDPVFRRPMSIHNCEDETFEMVFRVIGRGTQLLAEALPGRKFDCLGPLGNTFEIPENDETAVMVAGGVGLPPLYFLSRFLIERHRIEPSRVLFLLGIRDKTELIVGADAERLGVEMKYSTDDGTHGFHGFVTALFEDIYARRLRNSKMRVYSCGPTPMMQALSRIALSFKLPCQLSLEGAMPCGVGTCLGCAVKLRAKDEYLRVCQEGPVFNAEEIEL